MGETALTRPLGASGITVLPNLQDYLDAKTRKETLAYRFG